MSVSYACPSCRKRYRLTKPRPEKHLKCPACQAELTVAKEPNQRAKAKPQSKSRGKQKGPAEQPRLRSYTAEEVEKAVSAPIKRVRPALTYRLALVVATLMTLLVPIVYMALVSGVGYAIYYHAVNNASWIMDVRNARARVMVAIAYLGLIAAGVGLIAFMLKPFFTRQRHEYATRSLNRDREPALFTLVDSVCDAVGAKRPVRVDIDCQVNASASFSQGLGSFLGGKLVLTVGAPLVAGLTARELAGVLAHEFGHFSQGVGMRLTRILNGLNMWLDRVVNERDTWDAHLAQSAKDADLRLGWILYLAQAGVWLSRKLLWLLLITSRAISGYALRQMEYDADAYESRLVGPEVFVSTSNKFPRLGAGLQMAFQQANEALAEDKLIDNLPRMAVSNAARLSSRLEAAIASDINEGKTHWFDSHPATRDRIAAVHKHADTGVFSLDGPASRLFTDFDAQSKATTREFYRQVLNRPINDDELIASEEVESKQRDRDAAFQCLLRYTGALWRPRLRLGLAAGDLDTSVPPKETAAKIRELRKSLESNGDSLREQLGAWVEAGDRVTTAQVYECLHRVGVKFSRGDLDPDHTNQDKCRETIARMEHNQRGYRQRVEEAVGLTRERFRHTLQLLQHPKVAQQIDGGAGHAKRSIELLKALGAIEGQLDTINEIRQRGSRISALVNVAQNPDAVTDELVARLGSYCDFAHAKMTQVRDVLSVTADPLAERGAGGSLGTSLVPNIPDRGELGMMAGAVDECLSRISRMQTQIVAELAAIAERVEHALKLPQLPDPVSS